MEWLAEVETEESLLDPTTRARWRQSAVPGVPMYLLVPRGNRAVAEKLLAAAEVKCTGIYQYEFFNGVVQIL